MLPPPPHPTPGATVIPGKADCLFFFMVTPTMIVCYCTLCVAVKQTKPLLSRDCFIRILQCSKAIKECLVQLMVKRLANHSNTELYFSVCLLPVSCLVLYDLESGVQWLTGMLPSMPCWVACMDAWRDHEGGSLLSDRHTATLMLIRRGLIWHLLPCLPHTAQAHTSRTTEIIPRITSDFLFCRDSDFAAL